VALVTLILMSAGIATATSWVILSKRASATESSPPTQPTSSTLPAFQLPNFGLVPPAGPAKARPDDRQSATPSVITPISHSAPIPTSVPTPPTTEPPVVDPFYQAPDPLVAAPPGTVIRAERITDAVGLPPLAVAYRILYYSESITGAEIAVSGTVVIPGQPSPPGGYPIVTWAHATDGLADQCAPSELPTTSVPYLVQFLDEGMIVAATDYEGLGTAGIDPYLVGKSEGQAVLDAARAARNLVDGAASDSVIIFGFSQGGQAALFAGQMSRSYAPDLFVVGVVAAAPVSDVGEFVPAAPGSRPDSLSIYAVLAFYAWSLTYGDLPLSTVFTPWAISTTPALTQECSGQLAATYTQVPADQVFVSSWKDSPALQAHLIQNEPGMAPSPAPVLMLQGTDDTLIPYATTTALVNQRLCRTQHDTVDYESFQGANHGTVVEVAQSDVLQWIAARFAGQPAPDTCR